MAKVDQQLTETAKLNTIPAFQKCMCLIFDEVKIREDLVYDKNLFQTIGFVNVGNLNNRLLELERSEKGEQQQRVASNILLFMVRGLFSDLKFSICTISLHLTLYGHHLSFSLGQHQEAI
jgi:hypothetical protein